MQFIHEHSFFFGYLIGLLIAIAWGRYEVDAKREPQTLSSNILLVLLGWAMVPLFTLGYFIYRLYVLAEVAIMYLDWRRKDY